MKDFVRKFVNTTKGDVVNESGEVIGHHNGSILYTVGESQGFTITKKELQGIKMYVVDKNIVKNTITVSEDTLKDKYNFLVVGDLNLFCEDLPKEFEIRTRYRQEKRKVSVSKIESGKIYFEDNNRKESVAVGQSAVFYDGEKCLGGGIIEEV